MTVEEIGETYGRFPHETISDVMRVTSELLEAPNVAA